MKRCLVIRFSRLVVAGTAAVVAALCAPTVLAQGGQEFKFRTGAVTVELVDTPVIQYSGGGSTRAPHAVVGAQGNKWLRVEAQYDSEPEWADDVRLSFYVAGAENQKTVVLSGEESYINVPKGRGHFAVMLVHPKTVQRYLQGQLPKQVSVVLSYQSRFVDFASKPTNRERWWENFTPMVGTLLPRSKTPWSILDVDRYEAAKQQ